MQLFRNKHNATGLHQVYCGTWPRLNTLSVYSFKIRLNWDNNGLLCTGSSFVEKGSELRSTLKELASRVDTSVLRLSLALLLFLFFLWLIPFFTLLSHVSAFGVFPYLNINAFWKFGLHLATLHSSQTCLSYFLSFLFIWTQRKVFWRTFETSTLWLSWYFYY